MQDMLPLAPNSQISDADFNSQVISDGWIPEVVLSPWSSSHLEMKPYFSKTNFDSLISNSGHLLISNYFLKVVLRYITKPNAFFCSQL